MADIFHSFIIRAPAERVFAGISGPAGLDNWWTKGSSGKPGIHEAYQLDFGPQYHWMAVVSKFSAGEVFELTFTGADPDWIHTKVGFSLLPENDITEVNFYHTGWPQENEHYKISSYCWAMYLRILKRYLEFGEQVPYKDRLNV